MLDHFHAPLSEERHWDGFHSKWANTLVDELNDRWLPAGYFAEPHVKIGPHVEIDVPTFAGSRNGSAGDGASPPPTAPSSTPCAPTMVLPATFPDTFEVQIISTEAGPTVVAAIELVSPANKDRPEHRRAFAVKCASYLVQGLSLLIVDIVTTRHLNLHDEIVRLLPDSEPFLFPGAPHLYTAAYRPVRREGTDRTEAWLIPLAVGQSLPVMPLALPGNVVLSIDLESTYLTACRKLRLL